MEVSLYLFSYVSQHAFISAICLNFKSQAKTWGVAIASMSACRIDVGINAQHRVSQSYIRKES